MIGLHLFFGVLLDGLLLWLLLGALLLSILAFGMVVLLILIDDFLLIHFGLLVVLLDILRLHIQVCILLIANFGAHLRRRGSGLTFLRAHT